MRSRLGFVVAGLVGLGVGILLCLVAWWIPQYLASLAILGAAAWGSKWPPRLFLLALGLIVTVELPLMLYVMLRLARNSQRAGLVSLTHAGYVAFPGIYALLGTVLTGERWWAWVMLFLSGIRVVISSITVPFGSR